MQCRFQQFTLIIGVIFCTALLYFYYSNYNFDFVTNADATTLKLYKSYHRTNSNATAEDKIKESVIVREIISTTMSLIPTITTTTVASILASTATKNLNGADAENDSVFLKISKEILQLKKKKADERKHLLKSKFLGSFYGITAPEAECPNLARIGKLGDGGKWICDPYVLLKQSCTFYSLGLNNEVSFDVELMELTKNQCKHIAVDMNEQRPEIIQSLPETNFLKGKISKHGNETLEYTLSDLLLKYNTSKIDIMKMDIEGSEYDVLDQLINIPICQLLVELHTSNKDYRIFYQWLNSMSKAGFYLLHFEINEGTLQACEFTLIHKSCLNDYGVTVIKKFLS